MDVVFIFSFVCLLVSVSALIIFLRRLGRGEISLVVREAAGPRIQFPRDVKDVVLSQNPWQVLPGRVSKSGLDVNVSSKVSFTATCFWDASEQAITGVLHSPERTDAADQRQLLQRALSNDCHRQDVVLMYLYHATSVAMAVHLLYVPSQFLVNISSQWVVSREGRACQLKQLFNLGVASDGDSTSKCVVCHTGETRHALLPCRHVAVCDRCSLCVGTCPVCRTPIQSHFDISPQSV